MKSRWHLSILIIILTIIGGVVGQQKPTAPNQEIVVHFLDDEVQSEAVKNTIGLVKIQLQSIGVVDFKVIKHDEGHLTISYYSDIDVAQIKEVLSYETSLQLSVPNNHENSNEEWPLNQRTNLYNLDVHEISNSSDAESGLGGELALIVEAKTDRFSNFKENISSAYIKFNEIRVNLNGTFKLNKAQVIAFDKRSQIFPEVRAGPEHNLFLTCA